MRDMRYPRERQSKTAKHRLLSNYPLSQHIGAPAVLAVKKDDMVEKGSIIAEAGMGLSVCIHASIPGKVIDSNEKYVIIERQEGRADHE